jgi:cytidyltransferase-like protein
MNSHKILSPAALAEKVAALKAEGKRVVHCHGVFDLMHIGHIRHFEEARAHGDVLVVSVTPDRFVNKGTNRPAFTGALRAESIAALGAVDLVTINKWPTAAELLRLVQPDVFCKGGEYRKRQVDADSALEPELAVARELGIAIEYTDGEVFSSSTLLNEHFSPFPPETDAWLADFRNRYTAEQIIGYLDAARPQRVLVVGEAIIDEYVFSEAIGKSTKDPVLACRYQETEAFAGGSLAIANHLAGFCDDVALVSYLGETERREEFVRQTLLPQVKAEFVTKHGAPTIHKRRFVDRYSRNKLLELYVMDDAPMRGDDEERLVEQLRAKVADYDLVVACDYGHGMLTPAAIEVLCRETQFLVVNTQSNAGNRGFNPVSKYWRADYVCLANHEVAIETRMRGGDPKDLLMEVAQRINCRRFTVTQGKAGSLHYEPGHGFTEVPAFATQITDRVGAGDALLALNALLVKQGAPWDVVGFAGNVAGAQLVAELGNRLPLRKVPVAKHITALLK